MDNLYCRYFIDEVQMLCEGDKLSLYLGANMMLSAIRMTSSDTFGLGGLPNWKLVTDEEAINLYKRFKLVVDYE